MKTILQFLVIIISFSNGFAQNHEMLYPFKKGKYCGYLDKAGKVIISPKYYAAGRFSEGLAPVRVNGKYGYIDVNGNEVIPPQFDFALTFDHGLAQVYIDGKPFFIDKSGKIIFQHHFKGINPFGPHSYSIAVTHSRKQCLINRKGELMADSAFQVINPFNDGVSVVYGLGHRPYTDDSSMNEKFEVGVIDTMGRWIIPFGKYKDIGMFKNGFAYASRFDQTKEEIAWSNDDALIDKKGNIKFIMPVKKYFLDFDNPAFYNGLSTVYLFPEPKDSNEEFDINAELFRGVIDTNGKILFTDTSWKDITPFMHNRAFVQNNAGKWIMIGRNGKQVGDSSYDAMLYQNYGGNPEDIFIDGATWVKQGKAWILIDTSEKKISEPKIFPGNDYRPTRVGQIIFYQDDISVENPDYSYLYGFWNSITNEGIEPAFHDIDMNGFNNDLVYAMKDGREMYINQNGKIIWEQSSEDMEIISNLNIDYMNRGYFYAHSKPYKTDLGGFGRSNNTPVKISRADSFPSKSLSVLVQPDLRDTIYGRYHAMAVKVGNTTSRTKNFNAQDSRLYMKVQALNQKGEWKDVEYLPSSWCGNSYHTLSLEPKHYWTFLTPVYEGEYKTRLRIELKYIDPRSHADADKTISVYSNEFEGSINPGQFWNKREYYPNGLMDPYND